MRDDQTSCRGTCCTTVLGALSLLVLLGNAMHVCGVDGIAVSCRRAEIPYQQKRYAITRFDIKNDDVTNKRYLFTTTSDDEFASYATLNAAGSHVAFFRTTSSGEYVSVMSIEGGEPNDITTLGNGATEKAVMDWPNGDWIYYTVREEGNMKRVNVGTGAVEDFASIGSGWQWELSSDASKGFVSVYPSTERCAMPNGSCFNPGFTGCGTSVSPSGQFVMFYVGGGHDAIYYEQWDGTEIDVVTWEDYNTWVVNADEMATTCLGFSVPLKVGVGGDNPGNRWSVNSDKWSCHRVGWAQNEADPSRYAFCGANMILINPDDQKVVAASKLKRACPEPNCCYNNIAACDMNVPHGDSLICYHAGDFWVTWPLTDVNEDLRHLVPDVPVRNRRSFDGERMAGRAWRTTGGVAARVNHSGPFEVRVTDLAGRMLGRADGIGPGLCRMRVGDNQGRVMVVSVRTGDILVRCRIIR